MSTRANPLTLLCAQELLGKGFALNRVECGYASLHLNRHVLLREIAVMKAGSEGGRVRRIIDPAVETDVIKLMAAAFDRALMSLALVPPDIVRDAMVRRIIEAAQAGERSLGELANAALGAARKRQHFNQ